MATRRSKRNAILSGNVVDVVDFPGDVLAEGEKLGGSRTRAPDKLTPGVDLFENA